MPKAASGSCADTSHSRSRAGGGAGGGWCHRHPGFTTLSPQTDGATAQVRLSARRVQLAAGFQELGGHMGFSFSETIGEASSSRLHISTKHTATPMTSLMITTVCPHLAVRLRADADSSPTPPTPSARISGTPCPPTFACSSYISGQTFQEVARQASRKSSRPSRPGFVFLCSMFSCCL